MNKKKILKNADKKKYKVLHIKQHEQPEEWKDLNLWDWAYVAYTDGFGGHRIGIFYKNRGIATREAKKLAKNINQWYYN
jgi:hypothetical protein